MISQDEVKRLIDLVRDYRALLNPDMDNDDAHNGNEARSLLDVLKRELID